VLSGSILHKTEQSTSRELRQFLERQATLLASQRRCLGATFGKTADNIARLLTQLTD
jgi:hypothetical protein